MQKLRLEMHTFSNLNKDEKLLFGYIFLLKLLNQFKFGSQLSLIDKYAYFGVR